MPAHINEVHSIEGTTVYLSVVADRERGWMACLWSRGAFLAYPFADVRSANLRVRLWLDEVFGEHTCSKECCCIDGAYLRTHSVDVTAIEQPEKAAHTITAKLCNREDGLIVWCTGPQQEDAIRRFLFRSIRRRVGFAYGAEVPELMQAIFGNPASDSNCD